MRKKIPPTMGETEKSRFEELAKTVRAGLNNLAAAFHKNVYEVGSALDAIKRDKLYRLHGTWTECCVRALNISVRRAQQFMKARRILDVLKANNCSLLPETESHLRALHGVDNVAEVWQKALENAPATGITAKHVAQARAALCPKSKKTEEDREGAEFKRAVDELRSVIERERDQGWKGTSAGTATLRLKDLLKLINKKQKGGKKAPNARVEQDQTPKPTVADADMGRGNLHNVRPALVVP
jgi:hypothetical protein